MFESFLFIPGNRTDIINNISNVDSDYKIIDFEDSISSDEISVSSKNLLLIKEKSNVFIRLSFYLKKNELNVDFLDNIVKLGYRNFIIPKIDNKSQLLKIKEFLTDKKYNINEFNFILLIESSLALMTIRSILESDILNIQGAALGSFDYCLDMNMEYDISNFSWARNYLLNISKAYKIKAIDIVSMEIQSQKVIRDEIIDSFRLGFEGKLFIHPCQIKTLRNTRLFSYEQIQEAYTICSLIDKKNIQDVNVFKYMGKVYEKPHINRMINIINWHKRYGKQ